MKIYRFQMHGNIFQIENPKSRLEFFEFYLFPNAHIIHKDELD